MSGDVTVRQATPDDIEAMSAMLTELRAAGLRALPSDVEFVRDRYVLGPQRISCAIAVDDVRGDGGEVLGLQILTLSIEGGPYDVEPGWGVIGTHVSPQAHRRGVGTALFAVTREAGEAAGLRHVDATIGDTNEMGLAYYEAMGFRTYRTAPGRICKRYDYP